MWLTVDLVDVALDLSLREELVVDVSLRVGVLHLLLEPSNKNTVSKTNFTAEYHRQKNRSLSCSLALMFGAIYLLCLKAKHISSHPVTRHTSYMSPSLNLWEDDGVISFLSPFFTGVISVASVVWAVSAFYCLMPKCSSASGRMSNYFTKWKSGQFVIIWAFYGLLRITRPRTPCGSCIHHPDFVPVCVSWPPSLLWPGKACRGTDERRLHPGWPAWRWGSAWRPSCPLGCRGRWRRWWRSQRRALRMEERKVSR